MRRTSAKPSCAERLNPAAAAANFSENKPLLYLIIQHKKEIKNDCAPRTHNHVVIAIERGYSEL
jgi:hypothetical protein